MYLSTTAAQAPHQLRRISCIGFDWRAEVSLRETLALLNGRTTDQWQYTDEPVADVLIYDSSNALAQAVVRRTTADQARACICFPSNNQDQGELALRYPFGASRLIRCLNHASQSLAGHGGSAADRESLSQRLDNAMALPRIEAIALRVGRHQGLLYPASRRIAWPVALDIDEIAGMLGGDVELTALGSADRALHDAITAQAVVEGPAEALLWAIGMTRSGGQLLGRIQTRQAYRLRRWPDFGVMGRRSADLRCTALLMQRALSVGELTQLSGLPSAVITAFLNAASLCGLLVADTASRAPERILAGSNSRFGGVLQRIRTAFALHDAA
ncbi:hypothetical protein [Solimonas terrae]|uniref:Uncharacterized protein n=1 Tax=Solimonas terrae TaxID=1396819 RepID=A0A6M2BSU5_9GAMM|nr:hypothetical protein [Solimonas terrae]NGY05666.1 hypothetical protein [Solimonas terrae]